MADGDSYASGTWVVKPGNEDQFVARWVEFLEWTRDNAHGFQGATLIREQDDTRHFVSFARWEHDDAQQEWRALPGFAEKIGACRELCEDMRGATFSEVASV
jgi:heme-degrading monooxygenase HmoA